MKRWRSNLKNVQVGTYLYADTEETNIYKKFRQYFRAEKHRNYVWRYVIKKDPSEELISEIRAYAQRIEEEDKEYYEFIDTVAQDVFEHLSEEDKQYINDHPDPIEHHFGMGLAIRNHYALWGEQPDFLRGEHPDDISSDISGRVVSLVVGYDYYNPFYRHVYEYSDFGLLRKLYYLMQGEYPDDILKKWENEPDDYNASEQAKKIVKEIVVNKERYYSLCQEYGVDEEHRLEIEKYAEQKNTEFREIMPYDIGLLECENLDIELRGRLIAVLDEILKNHPRNALEMPESIFMHKDAVLVAVRNYGESLERFKRYNKDEDVIRKALMDSGRAIQYVDKSIRYEKKYLKIAFSDKYHCPLEVRCMASYRDKDEWVKRALRANGEHIRDASRRIRDDIDMAIIAIKHNRHSCGCGAMRYLSRRLRDNTELALLDIREGNASVSEYSARLRDSDEIEEALLRTRRDRWKVRLMSNRISKKYDDRVL